LAGFLGPFQPFICMMGYSAVIFLDPSPIKQDRIIRGKDYPSPLPFAGAQRMPLLPLTPTCVYMHLRGYLPCLVGRTAVGLTWTYPFKMSGTHSWIVEEGTEVWG
jgi:hypothetical protein